MKYSTSMFHWILASELATSGFALALGSVLILAPEDARADVSGANCQIYTVLAMKTGDGSIPPDLEFIGDQLRDDGFAAFKGFRLLESRALELKLGATGVADMSSGHRLQLTLLGAEQTRLKLRATLQAGDKKLVDTDYKIEDAGILLLGGVRHPDGKIFFAIQCRGVL
jgi:hypothetical protein